MPACRSAVERNRKLVRGGSVSVEMQGEKVLTQRIFVSRKSTASHWQRINTHFGKLLLLTVDRE